MWNGKEVVRHEKVLPAPKKEPFTFSYGGLEITEMVSPGQIINKKKAWKREMIRRGKGGFL